MDLTGQTVPIVEENSVHAAVVGKVASNGKRVVIDGRSVAEVPEPRERERRKE